MGKSNAEEGIGLLSETEADGTLDGAGADDGSPSTSETPEEDAMPDNTSKDIAKLGCSFDVETAAATHGKNIMFFVMNAEGDDILAVSGQQGLSFGIEVETSETKTKTSGGWSCKNPGAKSWSCSTDGLACFNDPARKSIMKAIENGTALCVGIFEQKEVEAGTEYSAIRYGKAIPTSDEIEAPSDDNATFSCAFEGTGPCWLRETATEEQIASRTFVVAKGN